MEDFASEVVWWFVKSGAVLGAIDAAYFRYARKIATTQCAAYHKPMGV